MPKCFYIASDRTVYVCDMYGEKIRLLIYYVDNSLTSFGLDVSTARGLEVLPDGKIAVLDWHEKKVYEISEGALQLVSSKFLECSEMAGSDYARYLAEDEMFRYEVQAHLIKCSRLMGELSVAAVDENGNIAGNARFPLEEATYFPSQYIRIGKDGVAYFMIPTEKCLEIRKVKLGAASDSRMEELMAAAQKYEEASSATEQAVFAAPSFTRDQVSSRANQIIAQKWTLSADNTEAGASVTLPKYIQNIVDEGLLENGRTVELSGIPYCWGGFDSLYTSNTKGCSDFSEAIDEGCTAGNIDTKSSETKVEGTAGLDCSGFASAAYGFSSKWGTKNFAVYGNKLTDIAELQPMDFLVKSGAHVVLFYLWPPTGKSTMVIMEAAAGSVGKTVIREVSKDVYLKGYEMRSPW